ncbi:MAG TPA: ABC transporter permease [Streptosporangiaceae bacterium]|jgi:peptide/nickel transport system permease protein|nr:ABC transporter permease [Streptosporangiaceae bacterium]
MTRYLLRRVGQAAAVVVGLMILTFVMIHLEPGSAARATLGPHATAGRIAIFNSTYGLNQPLYRQFLTYLDQVAHGNLGTSYSLQQPVSTLIAQRLPRDLLLLGLSTVLALLLAVPMGIYQAARRNGVGDYALTGVSFTLYSMPDFFFAFLLIALFSVQLHLLPPDVPQVASVGALLADPQALVLPVVTLALVTLASYSRYMRSSAIDVLAQDYILVARAKGLPQRLILLRHVLRNALLPVITMVGLSFSWIVAGAVIVEEVFNYPGMGLLFYQAATSHDFPILLGSTLVVGVATVLGNLAADVAYGIVDPRIRYGRA